MSPGAKAKTGLVELDLVSIIAQTDKNALVPERYKLTDASQTSQARELGRRILSGERDFSLAFNGRRLFFAIARTAENGFYIVGVADR